MLIISGGRFLNLRLKQVTPEIMKGIPGFHFHICMYVSVFDGS